MKNVELGTTGTKVSEVALGAMPLGTHADQDASFALLDRYVADGGAFIDTADNYAAWWQQGTFGGQSETMLGRWFAARGNRDEIFLATKGSAGWTDPEGVWPAGQAEPTWDKIVGQWTGAGAHALRESLDGSLRRLGTDHVDLYYVHVDDYSVPLTETLEALASFVTEGKIRYYGYSNVRTWRLAQIRALCEQHGWPQPVALQQEHSYLQRRPGLRHGSIVGDEQLDYLEAHPDLTLTAYSPLLKGLYDLPAAERTAQENFANYAGEHSVKQLAVLDEVAAAHGVAPSVVVLAWFLAQESPRRIPIIGTSRVDRWTALAAAIDLELSTEELTALDAA
ncbi:MAG: aldo/keto reductase [Actinomycetales bacterium]|nr:aldo/keto reductase [Actinomycetales bacterium]